MCIFNHSRWYAFTDYQIIINSSAASTCSFESDSMEVQEFDINSLRVTAQVMAQTVAMDFFEKEVIKNYNHCHDYNHESVAITHLN